MKKVAIVGIQGLPANYGGFESLVENMLGDNCSPDVQYTVFCSAPDMKDDSLKEYKGAKLEYIDCPSHGMSSIKYYTKTLMKVVDGYDVVLVLGLAGGLYMPIFKMRSKSKLICNVDGIERKRAKWSGIGKLALFILEQLSTRTADVLISDNEGIRQYIKDQYGKDSVMIAYGGDHVKRDVPAEKIESTLAEYGLKAHDYAITVCRIEPENNCHVTLEAFAKAGEKLMFIGNWDRSEYGRDLKAMYSKYPNIKIQDPVYDLDTLYALRSNAKLYMHGHSVGGTNPSLVEAMFFGIPILSYDVVFNRETTCNKGYYFKNEDELIALLKRDDLDGKVMAELAEELYTWKHITKQYEELY